MPSGPASHHLINHVEIQQGSEGTQRIEKSEAKQKPIWISTQAGAVPQNGERVNQWVRSTGGATLPIGSCPNLRRGKSPSHPALLDWYREPPAVFAEAALKSVGTTKSIGLQSNPAPAVIAPIENTIGMSKNSETAPLYLRRLGLVPASRAMALFLPELCQGNSSRFLGKHFNSRMGNPSITTAHSQLGHSSCGLQHSGNASA